MISSPKAPPMGALPYISPQVEGVFQRVAIGFGFQVEEREFQDSDLPS